MATGTICKPRLASFYATNYIGLNVTEEYFRSVTEENSNFPDGMPVLAGAIFFYILSWIRKKTSGLRSQPNGLRSQPKPGIPRYVAQYETTSGSSGVDQRGKVTFSSPRTGKIHPISEPTQIQVRPAIANIPVLKPATESLSSSEREFILD